MRLESLDDGQLSIDCAQID
jgi:hypothetical protein